MEINLYEQIGIGNFAGDTDEQQKSAATKFAELLKKHFAEYCAKEYPDVELTQKYPVENVSGCTTDFTVLVLTNDFDAETKIEHEIESEYEAFCSELERNGTIYE